ncbi:hypothetical protein LMIY3S_01854 [Labrys miyagiensis]
MKDETYEPECWWAHLTVRDVPYDAFSWSPAEAVKTLRNGILHDPSAVYDPTWFEILMSGVKPVKLKPGAFFRNGGTILDFENIAG